MVPREFTWRLVREVVRVGKAVTTRDGYSLMSMMRQITKDRDLTVKRESFIVKPVGLWQSWFVVYSG